MALTPLEEAMHLEVQILRMFKPHNPEEEYIYRNAMAEFFSQHQKYILDTIDQHLTIKAKE